MPPDRYHMTLRFMGDVSPAAVGDLVAAVKSLEAESPFRATLGDVGTFPRRASPRVYWIAVKARPLSRLRDRLDAGLLARGFPADGRRFQPHLTLGRARRRGGDQPTGHQGARSHRPETDSLAFRVRAIELVRSELFPTGPRYANIHRVVLSGDGVIAE